MEIIKEYPILLRVINCGRVLVGEARVRKNLVKICKNNGIYQEDLNEALKELLVKVSEKEVSFILLIEFLDDVFEHIKFKPEKAINLEEYLSTIISTYNAIKRA